MPLSSLSNYKYFRNPTANQDDDWAVPTWEDNYVPWEEASDTIVSSVALEGVEGGRGGGGGGQQSSVWAAVFGPVPIAVAVVAAVPGMDGGYSDYGDYIDKLNLHPGDGSGEIDTAAADGALMNDEQEGAAEGAAAEKAVGTKGWAQWISVMIGFVGMNVPFLFTFTSVFVFINNSVPPSMRGRVNGIGQTLVAITRFIMPMVVGTMFAWSESNGFAWPLNFHSTWYMLAAIDVLAIVMCGLLPESIEMKRK
jgi:hypothetical protein